MSAPRSPRSHFYDGWIYARTLDRLLADLHQLVADRVEPARRILDVGCGTGDLAWRLAPKAEEVVGIELSPAMVDFANRARATRVLPNVSFVLGDVTKALADLPDGHFDLATTVLVLHEMPAEAWTPVLREVTRVAGRLLCVDFRAPMPWNAAGIRNRLFEITAGREHYRAFRDFQRRGGCRRPPGRPGSTTSSCGPSMPGRWRWASSGLFVERPAGCARGSRKTKGPGGRDLRFGEDAPRSSPGSSNEPIPADMLTKRRAGRNRMAPAPFRRAAGDDAEGRVENEGLPDGLARSRESPEATITKE